MVGVEAGLRLWLRWTYLLKPSKISFDMMITLYLLCLISTKWTWIGMDYRTPKTTWKWAGWTSQPRRLVGNHPIFCAKKQKHPAPKTVASTLSMSVSAWYCPLYPGYSISSFWANYHNSLTWIKTIWGWFPLLTMISSEGEQWGRYNLPSSLYYTSLGPIFLHDISMKQCKHIPILMLQAKISSSSFQPESDFTWRIIPLIKYTHSPS